MHTPTIPRLIDEKIRINDGSSLLYIMEPNKTYEFAVENDPRPSLPLNIYNDTDILSIQMTFDLSHLINGSASSISYNSGGGKDAYLNYAGQPILPNFLLYDDDGNYISTGGGTVEPNEITAIRTFKNIKKGRY
jgi:hypothetical protein